VLNPGGLCPNRAYGRSRRLLSPTPTRKNGDCTGWDFAIQWEGVSAIKEPYLGATRAARCSNGGWVKNTDPQGTPGARGIGSTKSESLQGPRYPLGRRAELAYPASVKGNEEKGGYLVVGGRNEMSRRGTTPDSGQARSWPRGNLPSWSWTATAGPRSRSWIVLAQSMKERRHAIRSASNMNDHCLHACEVRKPLDSGHQMER